MKCPSRLVRFVFAIAASSIATAGEKVKEPVGFKQMAVTFDHHNTKISGRILVPKGTGPHQAVILVPGHGTRSSELKSNFGYLMPLGKYLCRRGIAVLDYDRPGTGGSDGDWRLQNLYDRADEVLAAIEFLKKRFDIDRSRIGVLGHSNGGWVAPLVASLSNDVSFVVMLAGPAVSVGDQGLYALRMSMEDKGFTDVQKREGEKMLQDYLDLIRLVLQGRRTEFSRSRDQLIQNMDACSWLGKLPYVNKGSVPTWDERNDVVNSMDSMIDYDPLPSLRKVHCPLLAVFGEADKAVNSQESVKLLEKIRSETGNDGISIKTYPLADHGIRVDGKEPLGFREFVSSWILSQQPMKTQNKKAANKSDHD